MFRLWIDAIHPEKYQKVIKNQKGKGIFLWDSVKIITLAIILSALVQGVISVLAVIFGGLEKVNMLSSYTIEFGLILLFLILMVLFQIVFFILNQYIIFHLAKMFGGKGGKIDDQAHLSALIYGGVSLISIPMFLIVFVPCLGYLLSAIAILVTVLWMLYLIYIVIKTIHSLSDVSTIIVIILDIVAIVILAMIVGTIMAALGMGAMFLGGTSTTAFM